MPMYRYVNVLLQITLPHSYIYLVAESDYCMAFGCGDSVANHITVS